MRDCLEHLLLRSTLDVRFVRADVDARSNEVTVWTTSGPFRISGVYARRLLTGGSEAAFLKALSAAYDEAFPVPDPGPPLDFGPTLAAWKPPSEFAVSDQEMSNG